MQKKQGFALISVVSTLSVAILAGCTSSPKPVVEPLPVPVNSPTGHSGNAQGYKIGRQFAGPNTNLAPMPTLTIILKPYDQGRNIAVCEGFLGLSTVADLESGSQLLENIIPLRWTLTREVSDPDNCGQIIGAYDGYTSGQLLWTVAQSTVDAQGKHLDASGKGPFIIEEFADEDGLRYVFIDLSNIEDNEFNKFSDTLRYALKQQSDALKIQPVPAEKEVARAPTSGTSATAAPLAAADDTGKKPKSFLSQVVEVGKKLCDGFNSSIGKGVRVFLATIAQTKAVAVFLEPIGAAACSTKGSADSASGDKTEKTTGAATSSSGSSRSSAASKSKN